MRRHGITINYQKIGMRISKSSKYHGRTEKEARIAKVASSLELRDMPGGSYYNFYLMPIIAEDRRMKKVHNFFLHHVMINHVKRIVQI